MAITPEEVIKQEKRRLEKPEEKLTPQQKKIREKEHIGEEKRILEEERIFREGVVSIKDLVAPAALEVTPTFIKLGQKFVRTMFVIGYPRYIAVGWFAPVINLSVALDIAMFFKATLKLITGANH